MYEGKASAEECPKALNDFQNEKSPEQVDYRRSFITFLERIAALSISQRRGIIMLMPKPNKDNTSLDNLKPISLLSVDYKILTKQLRRD